MGRHLRRRPVDDIEVHHISHANRREGDRRRPASGGGRSRGYKESDRTGRRHAVAMLVLGRRRKLWSGKYKTTGHGSLIVTNLLGRITFVSDPVTGNQHDMAKLKGSDAEKILKKAGGVFGDKGFVGTDYITTPIRKPECRELLRWEHEWNNQVSSFRAPVERAVATLKTLADSFHRLPSAVEDLQVIIPRRNRAPLLQREFWITLQIGNTLGKSLRWRDSSTSECDRNYCPIAG